MCTEDRHAFKRGYLSGMEKPSAREGLEIGAGMFPDRQPR